MTDANRDIAIASSRCLKKSSMPMESRSIARHARAVNSYSETRKPAFVFLTPTLLTYPESSKAFTRMLTLAYLVCLKPRYVRICLCMS